MQMLQRFIVDRAIALSIDNGVSSRKSDQEIRLEIIKVLGITSIPKSSKAPAFLEDVPFDGFTIRKLIFEPVPNFPISAHLYLPEGTGPFPAVVHTPGHWMEDAKLAAEVQRFNINLVKSGIAVLCYDPMGQGERRIGWHQHGQLAPLLVGITTVGLMVNETLAGVDLLSNLESIDAERIGVVGASGGGFVSIFAAIIDERIKASAIGCIVNTHVSQIRDAAFGTGWDSWIDLCNQIPELSATATMGKLLSTILDRKLIVANSLNDPGFPIAGAREVAAEVRAIATGTQKEKNFEYKEVPGAHGLHPEMSSALITFLSSCLNAEMHIDTNTSLAFNPQWPVAHELASAENPQPFAPLPTQGTCFEKHIDVNLPLVQLTESISNQLKLDRAPLTREGLQEFLGSFPEKSHQRPNVIDHKSVESGYLQTLKIHSEDGIELDALLLLPKNWSDKFSGVFVILHKDGGAAALESVEAVKAHELGYAIFSPDLRGTGKQSCSEFETASAAWMLDRDLLNQRVWDCLTSIDFLSHRYSTGQQIDKSNIVMWGQNEFGLLALIAAALDPRISKVGSTGIGSFSDLITLNSDISPMFYKQNLLRSFDSPELRDLVAPRGSAIGSPQEGIQDVLEEFLSSTSR